MGIYRGKHYAKSSGMDAFRILRKKKLMLSIVSLVLAMLGLVAGTACWFSIRTAEGNASKINLTVGNGLRVNDLGREDEKFNDQSFLLPASSVDGRNLFFPTDGTDFSKRTSDMTFRSANAGDRNYDYVQLDFNLTAEANYTGIYLDKTSSVKIDVPEDASSEYRAQAEKAEKAIRTAIYYDGMDAPVVFTSQMNPCSVNAVKDIDRTTGRFLESANQLAVPFKDYSYGKHQLAMLQQGETRPFSLIIWLEGTDENNCISDGITVMLKQLKLNLKFTTSWDNTESIYFKDNTNGSVAQTLVEHPEYTLVLNYNNKTNKINNMKFNMQKTDTAGEWVCKVPGTAYNDLSFMILDGSNNNRIVAEWSQTSEGVSTLNRGTATRYYADTFTVEVVEGVLQHSAGHWHDGDIEDHGEGRDEQILDDDDW